MTRVSPTNHIPVEVMPGIETAPDVPSEQALVVWEAGPPPQDIGEEPLFVMEPATREEDAHNPISKSEYSPQPEDQQLADQSSTDI